MRLSVRPITGLLVLSLAGALGACGDDGGSSGASANGGEPLRVYSSLPLQGAQRIQSQAVVNGIKLALKQAGGRAGDHAVTYQSLDDSTAQAGAWTPEATQANARKAAQDEAAVAYIGEANSGASAVSIPILNEAGLPQVSYSNTAVGLTSDAPGAQPGEPEKYYPTGRRTYARIVPMDTIQGAALASLMKQDGCTRVAMTNDKEVYGAGLGGNIERAADEQGLEILFNDAIDKNAPNYRSLAQKAAAGGADCFLYSGITPNNAVQLFKDFAAALPDAKLYGPDGVAESSFSDPREGGVPPEVAKRIKVTIATLSPDEYPPDAKDFFEAYTQEYGDSTPDPYAIYGFEAMNLVLDAIERSGSGEREGVLEALFATRDRDSVLGTYSIDENGDTTLTDYGVYRIADGELRFDETIHAAAG